MAGQIARSSLYLFDLGMGAGHDFHARAYPIAIAFDPNGFNFQPVVFIPTFVAEQCPFLIKIYHENVGVAVVIVIAKGGTTPHPFN